MSLFFSLTHLSLLLRCYGWQVCVYYLYVKGEASTRIYADWVNGK